MTARVRARSGCRVRTAVRGVLAAMIVVFALFPVVWMMVGAVTPRAATSTSLSLTSGITLDNFAYVLGEGGFLTFLMNSALVAIAVVVVSGGVTLLAAVAVARFAFRFRTIVLYTVLIVQMVPLEALVIPLFLQVRDLGLLNSLLGLILVYVALAIPFGIWMLRGFVAAIPVELEEAAALDGAGWWRTFRSVLLPLVLPGLVATSVFSFITAWNELIFALTLLGGAPRSYTVSIGLTRFFGQHANEWGYVMAASTIITVPVLVFFVLVQRPLAGGLVAGAVKG